MSFRFQFCALLIIGYVHQVQTVPVVLTAPKIRIPKAPTIFSCSKNFTMSGGFDYCVEVEGVCYIVDAHAKLQWLGASDACDAQGAYLPILATQQLNDNFHAVRNSFGYQATQVFPIGLRYNSGANISKEQLSPDGFKWDDGSAYAFSDWWGGKMDSDSGNVYVYTNAHWFDARNDPKYTGPVICQKLCEAPEKVQPILKQQPAILKQATQFLQEPVSIHSLLTVARNQHLLGVYQNKLIGIDGGELLRAVLDGNVGKGQGVEKQVKLTSRVDACEGVVGERIVRCFGYDDEDDDESLNSCDIYSLTIDNNVKQETLETDIHPEHGAACVANAAGHFHVFGAQKTYLLNLETGHGVELAVRPSITQSHAAVAYNDDVIVCGGLGVPGDSDEAIAKRAAYPPQVEGSSSVAPSSSAHSRTTSAASSSEYSSVPSAAPPSKAPTEESKTPSDNDIAKREVDLSQMEGSGNVLSSVRVTVISQSSVPFPDASTSSSSAPPSQPSSVSSEALTSRVPSAPSQASSSGTASSDLVSTVPSSRASSGVSSVSPPVSVIAKREVPRSHVEGLRRVKPSVTSSSSTAFHSEYSSVPSQASLSISSGRPSSVPSAAPSSQPSSEASATSPSQQESKTPSDNDIAKREVDLSQMEGSGDVRSSVRVTSTTSHSEYSSVPSAAPSSQPSSVTSAAPSSQPSSVIAKREVDLSQMAGSGDVPSSVRVTSTTSHSEYSSVPSAAHSSQPSSVTSAAPSSQPSSVTSAAPSSQPSSVSSAAPSSGASSDVLSTVPSSRASSGVSSVSPPVSVIAKREVHIPHVEGSPGLTPSVRASSTQFNSEYSSVPSPASLSISSGRPSSISSEARPSTASSVPSGAPPSSASSVSAAPPSRASSVPSAAPSSRASNNPSANPSVSPIPSIAPPSSTSSDYSAIIEIDTEKNSYGGVEKREVDASEEFAFPVPSSEESTPEASPEETTSAPSPGESTLSPVKSTLSPGESTLSPVKSTLSPGKSTLSLNEPHLKNQPLPEKSTPTPEERTSSPSVEITQLVTPPVLEANEKTNTCQRYVVKENIWKPFPSLNKARGAFSLLNDQHGGLVAIGGNVAADKERFHDGAWHTVAGDNPRVKAIPA